MYLCFLNGQHPFSFPISQAPESGTENRCHSCTNSAGLELTVYGTSLRKIQRLHGGSVGRSAELISDVCPEHKIGEP